MAIDDILEIESDDTNNDQLNLESDMNDSEDILEISTEDESKYPTTYKDLLEIIPDVFEEDYSDEYKQAVEEELLQKQQEETDESTIDKEKGLFRETWELTRSAGLGLWDSLNIFRSKENQIFSADRNVTDPWDDAVYQTVKNTSVGVTSFFAGRGAGAYTGAKVGGVITKNPVGAAYGSVIGGFLGGWGTSTTASSLMGMKEIYASEYDKALEKGFTSETSDEIAKLNMLTQAPVEFLGDAVESLIQSKMLSKTPIIKSLTNSKAATYIKGKLKILDKKSAINTLIKLGVLSQVQGGSEGLEEGIQEIVSNFNLNRKAGTKIVDYTEGLWENVKGGYRAGMLGPGGTYVSGKIAEKISNIKNKEAFNDRVTEAATTSINDIKTKLKENYKISNESSDNIDINNLDLSDTTKHKFKVTGTHPVSNEKLDIEFTGTNKSFKETIINPSFTSNIDNKSIPENLQLENSKGEKVEWNTNKEDTYQIRDTKTNKLVKSDLSFNDLQQINFENDIKYRRIPEYKRSVEKEKTRKYMSSIAVDEYLNSQKSNNESEENNNSYEVNIPEDMKDTFGIRYVDSEEEANKVQQQYERAMGRQSNYIGNVKDHILNHNGVVYEDNGNYLVGTIKDNTFLISHFAPKSLRGGMEMLKGIKEGGLKVVLAVPSYQGNQLNKLGFKSVGQIPQYFDGDIVLKNVYANDIVSNEDIDTLYKDMFEGYSQENINQLLENAKKITGKKETTKEESNIKDSDFLFDLLTSKENSNELSDEETYKNTEEKLLDTYNDEEDVLFRKEKKTANDKTVVEEASTITGKNVEGKVTKSTSNELENPKIEKNQSEKTKKNIRNASNPGNEKFSENQGAGNTEKYQTTHLVLDDTSDNPQILLAVDDVIETDSVLYQNVKDLITWRDARLADNIIFLEGIEEGLVSKSHLKQAMINLCAKVNIGIYFDLDKVGTDGKAVKEGTTGATKVRNNLIVVTSEAKTDSIMHEFAHSIWDRIISKYDVKNPNDLQYLLDLSVKLEKIFPLLDSSVDIESYKEELRPGEIFSEFVGKFADNPIKVLQLKKNSEFKEIFDLLDKQIKELDCDSEFNQVLYLSDRLRNQSSSNTALAQIIMRDLPYSRMKFVSRDPFATTKFQKLKFKTREFLSNQLYRMLKTIDEQHPLNTKLDLIADFTNKSMDIIKDDVAFLRTNVIDTTNAFIFGQGMTFNRSFIAGFKNLNDIRGDFEKAVDSAYDKLTNPTVSKEQFKKTSYRQLYLYLQVMNTIGENLGTQETLALIQKEFVSIKDTKSFGKLSKDLWLLNELGLFEDISNGVKHRVNSTKLRKRIEDLKNKHEDINQDISVKSIVDLYNKYKKIFDNKSPEVIKNIQNTIVPTNTGISIIQAFTVYEDLVNNNPLADTFASTAQDYYTLQDHVLNYMEQASTTTRSLVKSIKNNSGAFYIPLMRNFLEYEKTVDREIVNENYKAFTREGSSKPITDIFKAVTQQIQEDIKKANTYSSLESLANISNQEGGGLLIRKIRNPEIAVDVPIKDQYIKAFSEIKRKIKDDSELNEMEKDQLIKYINHDLSYGSTPPKKLTFNTVHTETLQKYLQVINNLQEMGVVQLVFSTLPQLLNRTVNEFSIINADGKVETYLMSGKDLLDGIAGAIKPTVNDSMSVGLRTLASIQRWLMEAVRAGYLVLNPGFHLLTTPTRDMIKELLTTRIYEDKALITPQQIYEVFSTYMRTYLEVLFPKMFKSDVNVQTLGKFGTQYSSRVSSLKDMERLNSVEGKWLPRGGMLGFWYFTEKVYRKWEELGEHLGLVGRITELKLMLKKDNINVDIFDVSKHNLQQLTGFTKNTLQKCNITSDILKNILTEEQFVKYLQYGDDTPITDIFLNENQVSMLSSFIPNNISVTSILGKNITSKYARFLREASVDFTRGSNLSRKINQYVLFFNSTVNGIVDYTKFIKRSPRRAAMMAVDLIFLGALRNMLGFGTDDDPNDESLNGLMRFKFDDNFILKIAIDPELGILFRLGGYLYDFNPETIGSFLMQVLRTNTIGIVSQIKGLPELGVMIVFGAFGANPVDLANHRNLHSNFKWDKFKHNPEKLVNKSTTTLALALNRVLPFISPEMLDHLMKNVIGYAGAFGKGIDHALAIASKIDKYKDLYNSIRVKLNPEIPLKNPKTNIGYFLGFNAASQTYTAKEIEIKNLASTYKVAYDDAKMHNKLSKGEIENLHQRYLITNYMNSLVNIYNKLLPLATTEEDTKYLNEEKEQLLNATLEYVKKEGIYYNPSVKKLLSTKAITYNKGFKKLETAKKQYLLNN